MQRTSVSRRFSGHGPRPDHNVVKQREAQERLEYWQSLSLTAQLKALETRPGESKRQRAKLEFRLNNKKKAVMETVTFDTVDAESENANGNRVKAKDRRAAERSRKNKTYDD